MSPKFVDPLYLKKLVLEGMQGDPRTVSDIHHSSLLRKTRLDFLPCSTRRSLSSRFDGKCRCPSRLCITNPVNGGQMACNISHCFPGVGLKM